MSQLKSHLLLLTIIAVAAIFRFLFLQSIPPAIGGDELQYVLNARTFLISGYDMSGKISLLGPLLFQYPVGILPQAELPYYLLLPFVAFGMDLLTARLPFYLLGVAMIPVMYGIGRELGGKRVGLFAALLTAFNPWLFFISHTGYESIVAMFFYFLGIYFLLSFKGNRKLLSLPIFLLAFYSYIGTKVIFAPLVAVCIFYLYYAHKKSFESDRKGLLSLFLCSIIISVLFLVLQQSTSRVGEIQTPFSQEISEQVNTIRKITISHPLLSVIENKFTIYIKTVVDKIFAIFSTQYLFVSGDGFFGLWRHGLFYLLDAFFIVVGILFIFMKKRLLFYFLLGLLAVSILPQILHRQVGNFTPHVTLIVPVLLLIAAFGIAELWNVIRKQRARKIIQLVCIALYVVSIGYFLHLYIYQYPLQGAFDLPTRTLSQYISHADQKGQSVFVYSHRPSDLYKKYLFYTNGIQKDNISSIRDAVMTGDFKIDNVKFMNCGDSQKIKRVGVTITDKLCREERDKILSHVIYDLREWGEEYIIQGDRVCGEKSTWSPAQIHLSDFSLDELSSSRFCSVFIRRSQ